MVCDLQELSKEYSLMRQAYSHMESSAHTSSKTTLCGACYKSMIWQFSLPQNARNGPSRYMVLARLPIIHTAGATMELMKQETMRFDAPRLLSLRKVKSLVYTNKPALTAVLEANIVRINAEIPVKMSEKCLKINPWTT